MTNDANSNRNTIILKMNDQFNNFSSKFITEFNMLKINFQTMDANDRLILQSNNEISEDIRAQLTIMNTLKENMENMPNIINYIFQETIAAFISNQNK
jgi:hypothetical protein